MAAAFIAIIAITFLVIIKKQNNTKNIKKLIKK